MFKQDSSGNADIAGTLTANAEPTADTNDFAVQNSTGTTIAYVNSTGGLFLRGSLLENALFG